MKYWEIGIVEVGRLIGILGVLSVWAGLASSAASAEAIVQNRPVFEFSTSGVSFDADFEGARLNDCVLDSDGTYRIVIRPENEPINNSAWYAFRVSAAAPQTVTIQLTYEGGKHRYHPKVSVDGVIWRQLTGDCYSQSGESATLRIDVGPRPVWISAQEQIGVAELTAWMDKIAELPFVEDTVIGRSVGGRPVRQLKICNGEPRHAIAIVGRQHPPEVTGSMALMEFVETITGPSELARRFRQSFEIVVVPLMNPDGVAAGNWRHNLRGVDLNRDWGPFRQPETRSVRDAILPYQEEGTPRLVFFLDFHSTQHDVFYVQTGETPVWPDRFSERWLEALGARIPEYKVRQESNSGTQPLSKVWARKTMEVPAVIYEVGDNTDRARIRTVAKAAAEEMMRLLLSEIDAETIGSKSLEKAVLQVQ